MPLRRACRACRQSSRPLHAPHARSGTHRSPDPRVRRCPPPRPPATQDVAFGVFGLGNKQYEHFNAVGKRMEKVMTALGAAPVVRRGDGDDDECIDDDFEKW